MLVCREPAVIQTASAPEAPKGVGQHLSEFFKGIGTSFRRMVLTQEMLVTSVLLAVVWVAVALSYYGSILFGVHHLSSGLERGGLWSCEVSVVDLPMTVPGMYARCSKTLTTEKEGGCLAEVSAQ